MGQTNKTILIPSGAGAPGFSGIVRCLRTGRDVRILAGDQNPQAYGQTLADGFRAMPASSDSDYAQRVLEWALEEGAAVVFPITTRELLPLAERAQDFAQAGIALPISSATSLSVALDKGQTAEAAQAIGHPVPNFAVADNRYAMAAEARKLGYPAKRICFKPCQGNGSRGFGIIDAQAQHLPYAEQKAGALPMTLDEWMGRWPSEEQPQANLLAEFLPGREYSIDALFNQGQCLGVWVRSRDKMIGGISVAGEAVDHPSLEKACADLGQHLHLHGLIGFQHREDEAGLAKLLEINPRVQGTTSAWQGMGLNLPWALVQMALGKEWRALINKPKAGQRFVRFWDERTL
jgi:carbamoyl-phosphate synthase large subunit